MSSDSTDEEEEEEDEEVVASELVTVDSELLGFRLVRSSLLGRIGSVGSDSAVDCAVSELLELLEQCLGCERNCAALDLVEESESIVIGEVCLWRGRDGAGLGCSSESELMEMMEGSR